MVGCKKKTHHHKVYQQEKQQTIENQFLQLFPGGKTMRSRDTAGEQPFCSDSMMPFNKVLEGSAPEEKPKCPKTDQHIQIACSVPSCMHIAEENHLSDFQVHFLKEHAQCGKREVFLEFFNRAEEDDLVFHDLDHISTFKNSMLDEFCKLFGHLGFSSGALPSSTLLKGIIESLQKGCSPAVSRDRIATTLHHLILATLRHPQLTTLLTLQLRQNVFLRVPINVVGTGTCPFPVSLII
ncbi:hypothetical protein PAPYR_13003 [Paratrimastix pyriformis]|uniref:Uncharacterized protein n=1 Tax=Paratrimastix pyriformis TaxID=342808 RepID=A0ABQ8U5A0_9EUKA|nr:hypothetical protein PAPYR_13003 [Paratrimastix pyriformis]